MHPCLVPSEITPCNKTPLFNVERYVSTERYRPIDFSHTHGYPNEMPPEVRKEVPKFSG